MQLILYSASFCNTLYGTKILRLAKDKPIGLLMNAKKRYIYKWCVKFFWGILPLLDLHFARISKEQIFLIAKFIMFVE